MTLWSCAPHTVVWHARSSPDAAEALCGHTPRFWYADRPERPQPACTWCRWMVEVHQRRHAAEVEATVAFVYGLIAKWGFQALLAENFR
jgi:hypothetical protein